MAASEQEGAPLQKDEKPSKKNPQPMRSFVMRASRLTAGQARAMEELWPQWGLADQGPVLDIEAVFGRSAPLVVEIGFGNGKSLAQMAAAEPDKNFIGIEVHPPGVGHLLIEIERLGLTNLRILKHDAVEVLRDRFEPGSIDRLQLYFPDPWHKKRHNKRRIVQTAFVERVASRIREGGVWHLATDWQPYAEWMVEFMEASDAFENINGAGCYAERPDWRPLTKFEQRGQRLGHGVWDLLYRRK